MVNLTSSQSPAAMFATCLTLWVTAALLLITYLYLHARASTACRENLRPHAERLVIECRWMERHAKSRVEFKIRWHTALRPLYKRHVPRPLRPIFWFSSFERALYAEFQAIVDNEIASWTFLDRASFSPASYEALTLRCLKSMGWRLDYQDREHFVLLRDRKRIVVRLEWTDRDLECLAIHEVAAAAQRIGCHAACVITNGRFSGAACAMAEELNVVARHCSQLDLLTSQLAPAAMSRSASKAELPIAA